MTPEQIKATLVEDNPPETLLPLLKALWYDAKGDWDAAHDIAQSREGTPDYDRLHAYLHRKEGDEWNANYWYHRARTTMPATSLEAEWEELVLRFGGK